MCVAGLGLLQRRELADLGIETLPGRGTVEELRRQLIEVEEEGRLRLLDAVGLQRREGGELVEQLLQPLLLGIARHRVFEQGVLVQPLRIKRGRHAGRGLRRAA